MLCTILGTPSASQSLPTHHHILSQVPEISWDPRAAPIVICRQPCLRQPSASPLATRLEPLSMGHSSANKLLSPFSSPQTSFFSFSSISKGSSGQLSRHLRIRCHFLNSSPFDLGHRKLSALSLSPLAL